MGNCHWLLLGLHHDIKANGSYDQLSMFNTKTYILRVSHMAQMNYKDKMKLSIVSNISPFIASYVLSCSTTQIFMMTSSNGNIFRVTGLLCGEFTGRRCIPHTKASDAELWCYLWPAPEPTVEQTMETPVIWDAIALINSLRPSDAYMRQ